MGTFFVRLTENLLNYRRRKQWRRKEKKAKSRIPFFLRVLGEFLWAAVFVLLINQFFLQAYVIPSGSMLPVFQLQDRIFVNKFIFGPELLPGMLKIPRLRDPRRGEIVIFENPSYVHKGPLFTMLQRIIYMVTLSFVDIDRDENGRPKAQLLVKRVVACEGDRMRYREGKWQILPSGTETWLDEEMFMRENGYPYEVQRLFSSETIQKSKESGRVAARIQNNVALNAMQEENLTALRNLRMFDPQAFEQGVAEESFRLYPENKKISEHYRITQSGWYVSEGRFLPLGDNRDNSRDGRYFGSVPMKNILGSAWLRYWPFSRAGVLQ